MIYDAKCHHGMILHCEDRKPYRANGVRWVDFNAGVMTLRVLPALGMRRDEFGVRRLDLTTVELLEHMGPGVGPIFHHAGTRSAFQHKFRRLSNRIDISVEFRGRFFQLRGDAPSLRRLPGKTCGAATLGGCSAIFRPSMPRATAPARPNNSITAWLGSGMFCSARPSLAT